MRYEFHPDAEQELVESAAFYERNVTGLGERFGSEVQRAIERLLEYPELGFPIDAQCRIDWKPKLLEYPELGFPIDATLRRLVLTRFPYFLIYSFTTDLLRVVAVAHARRRPGYWRSRMTR
jgi:plasmid stabilization system protein ParE